MWRQLDRRSDAIRYFHPGWFASVMGTGILAVGAHHGDALVPGLESVAVALWLLTALMCAVLIVPWITRWLVYPREAWADTAHPTRGPFNATLPIGLLVLATGFAAIGAEHMDQAAAIQVAQVLWIAGTVLAFLFGVLIPLRWFTAQSVPLHHVNGGWFIPPVGNIVVPAAAAPLISTWGSEEARQFVCILSFALFGIGLLLFIMVGTLLIGRLVEHPLPEAHLAPTLWVGLGPIGVGSLALGRLSATATPVFGGYAPEAHVMLLLGATMLWGFGLWWITIALVLTAFYLRGPFPFAMSWWAFTFPLGAYTVATFMLGDAFGADYLVWFGFALLILLGVFWLLAFVGTIAGVYTGSLLKAPPPMPAGR